MGPEEIPELNIVVYVKSKFLIEMIIAFGMLGYNIIISKTFIAIFRFDSCIGQHNHCLFLLAIFFAICALLYSSNLTLTSVCHPFTVYKTILLPDDCSDVYNMFE